MSFELKINIKGDFLAKIFGIINFYVYFCSRFRNYMEYSEFEKFLLTYKDTYPDDVRQLVYRLDIIKRDGAEDRHFRYEGTKRDRVMALPSHLETTSLRLYLLNIQAKILILGNGGLKNTATYQEDENLHRQVKMLQKIDIKLKEREKNKVIVITGTELLGELSFAIDEE